MNIYLIIIVTALLAEFSIYNIARILNIRNLSIQLPGEFASYYNQEDYAQSQRYLKDNTWFSCISSCLEVCAMMVIIFFGLFNNLDLFIRSFGLTSIVSGLLFWGILFFLSDFFGIPFALYKIFIIEERYGFNKTHFKTFILDKIKGYFLFIVLGGPILYSILYFFETFGSIAWIYAALTVLMFILLIQPIFTIFIAPLFNSFSPLKEGKLKNQIEVLANNVGFPISRIDVMDGSRRSSKANAYFSGIGKSKRIALFDTLLANHSNEEILSIIAHEIGHFKKKHNIKGMILAAMQVVILFFLLSMFINNDKLFLAFKVQNISIYGGILFFMIFYSPINLIMNTLTNFISRKHEFEADLFARNAVGTGRFLIKGLKKLTVSTLGNLKPHIFMVWLTYSHPPIMDRIYELKNK